MYPAILFLGLTITSILAQEETFPGACPFDQVTHVANFDQKRFEGTWYEIERYHKSDTMDCIEDTFSWEPFDVFAGKFNIRHKEQNLEKITDAQEEREAMQTFRLPGQYFSPQTKWPFWVVQTDYDSYALVWGCWDEYTPDKKYSAQRLTVMARKRDFKISSVPSLTEVLNTKPFEASKMKPIIQDQRCSGSIKEGDPGKTNPGRNAGEGLTVSTIVSTIVMIIVAKLL